MTEILIAISAILLLALIFAAVYLAKEVKAGNKLYDKCRHLEAELKETTNKTRDLEAAQKFLHIKAAKVKSGADKKDIWVEIDGVTIREFISDDPDYNRMLAEELCDKLNETP